MRVICDTATEAVPAVRLSEPGKQLFAFGLGNGARNRRPHGVQDLNLEDIFLELHHG